MNLEKPIQVLIVDDHQLIIDGLKAIQQDETNVRFAGGANNLAQAIQFIEEHPVDVVLADINMPNGSGIELTAKLKTLKPNIQVLALTMHEDFAMINKMIEAGAAGYILKRTNMNEVLEAIRVVASGGKYLGRDVQAILFHNLADRSTDEKETVTGTLTSREKEILNLIAKELSNTEIAQKLFISERTVETHRRNIFTKTKTKSIVGLIKYAIANGLINQDPGE